MEGPKNVPRKLERLLDVVFVIDGGYGVFDMGVLDAVVLLLLALGRERGGEGKSLVDALLHMIS